MSFASRKVKNGKLIKARVESNLGKISSIKLTGDFFLYPEEVIFEIEKSLLGIKLDESEIEKSINSILLKNDGQLIGALPSDFAKLIMEASR